MKEIINLTLDAIVCIAFIFVTYNLIAPSEWRILDIETIKEYNNTINFIGVLGGIWLVKLYLEIRDYDGGKP